MGENHDFTCTFSSQLQHVKIVIRTCYSTTNLYVFAHIIRENSQEQHAARLNINPVFSGEYHMKSFVGRLLLIIDLI